MKKNTVTLFVWACVLGGSLSAFAQTDEQKKAIVKDYDVQTLVNLSEDYKQKALADRERAYQLAEVNGWPLTYETEKGEYAELIGVHENGNPHYYVTHNQGAAQLSKILSLNSGGSLGLDLNGQGMSIGVWDQNHPRSTHVTFGGRVIVLDGAVSQSFHSTHVLGTMIGSGLGDLQARGMAYQANGRAYDWNQDASEMTFAAIGGMLVSNHSYGSIAANLSLWEFGAYNWRSRQYDEIAYESKNYLIVQAAGNDRDQFFLYNPSKNGYDLINGTKTAKNALTVAAVTGSGVMSTFSSYGPTDDRRVKPDIAAKGVGVYSSSNASNTSYESTNGTSMASPVVAGGALLLQQHYFNLYSTFMRSATLRGLICHTADEAGNNPGPDGRFGWGIFNAEAAAQAITNHGTTSLILQRTLSQGEELEIEIEATGNVPVRASICWTDLPGTANNGTVDSSTPVLVNNLDIRATQNGETYLPWALTSVNEAAAVKANNIVDNFERIDIENPGGSYTVRVTHAGNIIGGPQEFSLIVTGISNSTVNVSKVDAKFFSVWPNPASSQLNINFDNSYSGSSTVEMYDVQGRKVSENSISGANGSINIEQLTNGVYIVKVTQGEKIQTKKIIVNK